MKTPRYLYPALGAGLLHSALLLAFDSPSVTTALPDETTTVWVTPLIEPVYTPPDEGVEVVDATSAGARRRTDDIPPPLRAPEPPVADVRAAFTMAPNKVDLASMQLGTERIPHDGLPGNGDGEGNLFGDGDGVLAMAMLDALPQATFRVSPSYPQEMKRNGRDGEVWVTFVVGRYGRVVTVRADRASSPEFAREALRAVQRWRFKPGQRLGAPVAFRMTVPIVFSLDDA